MGGNTVIVNREFRQTYDLFLHSMLQKRMERELSMQDKMVFVYYLQLQDRVEEAIKLFKTIPEECGSEMQIQYDYFLAYFDFFTGRSENYKIAR